MNNTMQTNKNISGYIIMPVGYTNQDIKDAKELILTQPEEVLYTKKKIAIQNTQAMNDFIMRATNNFIVTDGNSLYEVVKVETIKGEIKIGWELE